VEKQKVIFYTVDNHRSSRVAS